MPEINEAKDEIVSKDDSAVENISSVSVTLTEDKPAEVVNDGAIPNAVTSSSETDSTATPSAPAPIGKINF